MPYMTASALRSAVPALNDTGKYPDSVLTGLITEFEEIAEEYRGVAYIPRTATETFTVPLASSAIILRHVRVRSVTSVVIDGNTVDPTSYDYTDHGTLVTRVGFLGSAYMPVSRAVIVYSHGYDSPPQGVLRACRMYVYYSAMADRSAVPRDIIATSADGLTTRYSTPDIRAGRPTGYLDVDRLLNSQPDERMGFA